MNKTNATLLVDIERSRWLNPKHSAKAGDRIWVLHQIEYYKENKWTALTEDGKDIKVYRHQFQKDINP